MEKYKMTLNTNVNTKQEYEIFLAKSVKCMMHEYTAFLPSYNFLEHNNIKLVSEDLTITEFGKEININVMQIVPGFKLQNGYYVSENATLNNIENVLKEYEYLFSIEPTGSVVKAIVKGKLIKQNITYRVRGIRKDMYNFQLASSNIGHIIRPALQHTKISNITKDSIKSNVGTIEDQINIVKQFESISSINVDDNSFRVSGILYESELLEYTVKQLEEYSREYIAIVECANEWPELSIPDIKFFVKNCICVSHDTIWLTDKFGNTVKNTKHFYDKFVDLEKVLVEYKSISAITMDNSNNIVISGITIEEYTMYVDNRITINRDIHEPIVDISKLRILKSETSPDTTRYIFDEYDNVIFTHMGDYKLFSKTDNLQKMIAEDYYEIHNITQFDNVRVIVKGVKKK